MKSPKTVTASGVLIVLGFLVGILAGATAAEDRLVPIMIQNNDLLREIYKQDPHRAIDLASEIERTLRLAAVQPGDDTDRSPRLKYRGGTESHDPRDGEVSKELRQTDELFDENPVLRELYFRSPLASLRMLKRLREATKKK